MKSLMILTVGACLLLTSVPALADQAADEAAIRKVVAKLRATWDAKDVEAHMALIDENFVMNDLRKGKAAHREWLKKLFSSEEYSKHEIDEIDIIFVTPDVAIYRRSGLELKSNNKWTGHLIFSKKSGAWLLSASSWRLTEE